MLIYKLVRYAITEIIDKVYSHTTKMSMDDAEEIVFNIYKISPSVIA